MKPAFWRLFTVIISFTLLLTVAFTVDAFRDDENECADYIEIKSFLNKHSDFRNTQFFDEKLDIDPCFLSKQVYNDAQSRSEALKDMQQRIGASFVDVRTEFNIKAIELSDDIASIIFLEMNEIYYQMYDSNVYDYMEFGAYHKMTLRKTGDTYLVEKDLFDESLSSGAISEEYRMQSGYLNGLPLSEYVDIVPPIASTNTFSTWGSYNPTSAITYANQWYNGHNSSYSDYDNDGSPLTSDCCNFVSQCLHEGGIQTDGTAPADYSSGWYIDSFNWISVGGFFSYWANKVGSVRANGSISNMNNCIPGNPICAAQHAVLCTGYNGSGVPVYNAHSNPAYHIPITNFNEAVFSLLIVSCDHGDAVWTHLNNGTWALVCPDCGNVNR